MKNTVTSKAPRLLREDCPELASLEIYVFALINIWMMQDYASGALLFLCVFSMIYAFSHLAAWNAHFPSEFERWIWRVSCLAIPFSIMCVQGTITFMGWAFTYPSWPDDRELLEREFESEQEFGLYTRAKQVWRRRWRFPKLIVRLSIIIFILARIFIIVEAFISLRSLPIGSFQEVEWSSYWPHFG